MIPDLIDVMFGCTHQRTTFPRKHERLGVDYIVCLACGSEFEYDMTVMSVQQKLPMSYQHTGEPSLTETLTECVVRAERGRL